MWRKVFKIIGLYSRERSPAGITLLISVLLLAPVIKHPVHPVVLFTGILSAVLMLFLIRLSDDLCDLGIDRIAHPERLLCRDQFSVSILKRCRWLVTGPLIVMNTVAAAHPVAMLIFLLSALLICSLFFFIKPWLPTLVHTALLNAMLGIFPCYAGVLTTGHIGMAHLLMALFFWLGSFAHDLSHSLLDTAHTPPGQLKPLNRFNQKTLAMTSLALYLLSAGTGYLLFHYQAVSSVFLAALGICTLVIIRLECALIRHPTRNTARPFYVWGYLFFLLPVLADIAFHLFH
ncbi:hypothetical protein VA7868_02303 [Vibrio aerogenes CECT 7868]|uniref:Prenyltransferase n=1 Tax=Vibrio aerogenes CECT 7868 TaxID=1216006 RepID=A0A1M5Z4Z2_9VIBR|nr:hypothetical protein [Vibrio aerogenes]SHI19345.1 hypothetical protein VA7868_02303 [Vibrio aerogenes CECT 7868]